MAENHESAADEYPRKGNSAPGLEGEGGQYTEGDYGDVGSVEAPADQPSGGEGPDGDYPDWDYPNGDYGEAGEVGTAREADVDEDKNS
jgi:hypothetical protein